MKRVLCVFLVALVCFLAGCGMVVQEELSLNYADTYTISNEKLTSYADLIWESGDPAIVSVNDGTLTGISCGNTVVTAKSGDKIVAEYSVTVNIVPITNIVLSKNSTEIVEGEVLKLDYTLIPDNASDYGIQWKSADDSVVTVSQNGEISARKVGQTTVIASTADGVVAMCTVDVKQKPAYDRLDEREKEFVDYMLRHIIKFKNPDSVVINAIEDDGGISGGGWNINISAQNGFGGVGSNNYWLSSLGLDEWPEPIAPDYSYDIDLINEAIAEKR